MKKLNYLLVLILLLISACSIRPAYSKAPVDVSIAGTWKFVSQDEDSLQRLSEALNYVPLGITGLRNSDVEATRRANVTYLEQKMLRDLLVGLFSIIPNEIYIEQTTKQVAIDFGVAGYHTFNIAAKNELIMDGIEVDAYSGWKNNEFIIEVGKSSYYQFVEKFKVINNNQLLQTIELNIYGRDRPLLHKRYFKQVEE